MDFVVVKINGSDVSKKSHTEIVNAFRAAKDPIVVEVIRRNATLRSDTNNSQAPNSRPTAPEEYYQRHTNVRECSTQTELICPLQWRQPPDGTVDQASGKRTPDVENRIENRLPAVDIPTNHHCDKESYAQRIRRSTTNQSCSLEDSGSDKTVKYEEVTLYRSTSSEKLGLTISSEADEQDSKTRIFVDRVEPESIASKDGRIREDDQIIKINGIEVPDENQAIVLCSEKRSDFTFLVSRSLAKNDRRNKWKSGSESDFANRAASRYHDYPSWNITDLETSSIREPSQAVVGEAYGLDHDFQTSDETTCLLSSTYDLLATSNLEKDNYINVTYEDEGDAYRAKGVTNNFITNTAGKCSSASLNKGEDDMHISRVEQSASDNITALLGHTFEELEIIDKINNSNATKESISTVVAHQDDSASNCFQSSEAETEELNRVTSSYSRLEQFNCSKSPCRQMNIVEWFKEDRFNRFSSSSESEYDILCNSPDVNRNSSNAISAKSSADDSSTTCKDQMTNWKCLNHDSDTNSVVSCESLSFCKESSSQYEDDELDDASELVLKRKREKSKRSSTSKDSHVATGGKDRSSRIRVMFSPSTTMYTNRANLKHTIWLQQYLFRQALEEKYRRKDSSRHGGSISSSSTSGAAEEASSVGHGTHKSIHFHSSGQRLLSDYRRAATPDGKREGGGAAAATLSTVEEEEEVEPGAEDVQMKWKVKRRSDGTRYITRRQSRDIQRSDEVNERKNARGGGSRLHASKNDKKRRRNKQIDKKHEESLQVKSSSRSKTAIRGENIAITVASKKSSSKSNSAQSENHSGALSGKQKNGKKHDNAFDGTKIESRHNAAHGRKQENSIKTKRTVLSVTTV